MYVCNIVSWKETEMNHTVTQHRGGNASADVHGGEGPCAPETDISSDAAGHGAGEQATH